MISKIYSGIEVKCNEEDLNKKGVIYCLTFENGKCYIGQTTKMLHIRISQHCHIKNRCTKLKNAIKKYKSFTLSILSSNLDINQMNLFEQIFIQMFNSNGIDGYNLDSGGKNKNLSDETKNKMSKRMKGNTYWLGKTHSDETKLKMSGDRKGKNKGKTAHNKGVSNIKCYKKVKSIPDNIIFNSINECSTYYNIHITQISRYYKGRIHKKSGQTFVLL